MLKYISYILLCLILVSFSSTLMAQDIRPGKWWKDPRVTKELALTDSQLSRLDKAYNKSHRNMIQQKSEVEKESFELQNLFEKKDVDEAAIEKQHRRVERAREKLRSERLKFIMEARRIIGSEKYGQLKLIFSDSFRNKSKYHKGRNGKK